MKKHFALAMAALLLAGCAPWKIVVAPSEPLNGYGKVEFAGWDDAPALAALPEGAKGEKIKGDIGVMEKQTSADFVKWASERKDGANGKTLSLKMELQEYVPNGLMSDGHITWLATFSSGGKVVAQSSIVEKYSGGSKTLIFMSVYTMTKRFVELN